MTGARTSALPSTLPHAPVIVTDGEAIVLDLSRGARLRGRPVEGLDVAALSALINEEMQAKGTGFAFGRYLEPRGLYANEHFAAPGAEARTVHLGIDVFCDAGTAVFAPLDGNVAVVANNDRELDYGPLLILEHASADIFTLYGHLGSEVLSNLEPGAAVASGTAIATVGAPPGNGNWPPHLHFQVIRDLAGLGSEFPGVAAPGEIDRWAALSPSPARFFPEIDPVLLEYRACS